MKQTREMIFVKRAFRITKGKIELRPMFHFTPRRIDAHVCICFVAFNDYNYKELERILKKNDIKLSVDKVLGIAKTIPTIKVEMPARGTILTKTMLLTSKHKSITMLFNENLWKNI